MLPAVQVTRNADHFNGARKSDGDQPARRPLIDEQLADELLGKPQVEGVELLGPDGLLSQVTKAVLELALVEEMVGHLGHEKHDPPIGTAGTTGPDPAD